MTSDVELVARSRNRDADAFGALVARHQQLVFGVALAHCQDPALAEDVAQEAFVAAWRDLDRLRDGDRIGPWVAGIARNLAASAARTRARRERVTADSPTGVPSPEDEALEREDRELLHRALGDLSGPHREALVLFYLEGKSIAQIAGALGVTEDVVKQRLSRGRRALRDGVADRVESVLARTRLRPAFGAGVVALLSTAGARKAAAGKVVFVMTAKKLVLVIAGTAALAGGAFWLGTRDKGGGEAAAAPKLAAPAVKAAHGSAEAPSAHVGRIDRAARDRLLAQIRETHAERAAAPAAAIGGSRGPGERPSLAPVEGELDKDYIRASVKEIVPMLAECYQEGLARDPKLRGSVVVDFTIEGEQGVGGVIGESTINTERTEIADPTVRECIQQTMYAIQIDPPSGGGIVHVTYPFQFEPGP